MRTHSRRVRLARRPAAVTLGLSHTFCDGKLPHAAGQNAPYVAGTASGWIKVKTPEWREANRERYKLFDKT